MLILLLSLQSAYFVWHGRMGLKLFNLIMRYAFPAHFSNTRLFEDLNARNNILSFYLPMVLCFSIPSAILHVFMLLKVIVFASTHYPTSSQATNCTPIQLTTPLSPSKYEHKEIAYHSRFIDFHMSCCRR